MLLVLDLASFAILVYSLDDAWNPFFVKAAHLSRCIKLPLRVFICPDSLLVSLIISVVIDCVLGAAYDQVANDDVVLVRHHEDVGHTGFVFLSIDLLDDHHGAVTPGNLLQRGNGRLDAIFLAILSNSVLPLLSLSHFLLFLLLHSLVVVCMGCCCAFWSMLLALIYRLIIVIPGPKSTWLCISGRSCEIWRNVDTSTVHGTCCHILTVAKVADSIPCQTVQAVVLGAVVGVR